MQNRLLNCDIKKLKNCAISSQNLPKQDIVNSSSLERIARHAQKEAKKETQDIL